MEACLSIFDSNCPPYFALEEREAFEHWLVCRGKTMDNAYKNTSTETYRVIENEAGELVGCGGYYLNLDQTEARFAWGMIRKELQHHGIGTYLAQQRIKEIKRNYPLAEITLATSQHTHLFYSRLGFEVLEIIPSGFAPNLDKYEMKLIAN
jgi:N-acetylglutamate synthase-like GNAT family acetyltransferase